MTKIKDDQEIESVLNQYGDTMFRVAYSILGNPFDVQDVLQEVMIRYMRRSPTFEKEEDEKAWLIRVTSNLAKDTWRFQKRHTYIPLEEQQVQGIQTEQKDIENSNCMEILQKLPVKYRIVIEMYYVEGYSVKEIAILTKQGMSAVKKQLQRGRDKIKEVINSDLEGELYESFI